MVKSNADGVTVIEQVDYVVPQFTVKDLLGVIP